MQFKIVKLRHRFNFAIMKFNTVKPATSFNAVKVQWTLLYVQGNSGSFTLLYLSISSRLWNNAMPRVPSGSICANNARHKDTLEPHLNSWECFNAVQDRADTIASLHASGSSWIQAWLSTLNFDVLWNRADLYRPSGVRLDDHGYSSEMSLSLACWICRIEL